jgi:hypothetical protein
VNNNQSRRLIGPLNRPRGGQPNSSPRFTNTYSFTGPAQFFPSGNVNSTQVAAGNEVGNQIGGGNQTPIITVATHTVARFNVQILVGQISVMIPVTVVLGETTPLGNVVDGAGLGQQHTRAVLDQILGNVGGIVQNVVNGSIQQAQGVDSVQQSQIGNVVQQAHGGVNVQLGNATPTILGNVVQQAQGVDNVQ